ncbi:HIV Tat-specific factor 1-like protein [Leptotrombidium deliense]|uniref:HIV Tat-specific factor 1-like protein n=1 Tax=Leptotrombidium deliense TaxID=299467 RepID=A0A443SH98_9ACAR|nr:HIV Tat-specific factor 1-like protein [Leptotrombidium deliense]
MNDNSNDEFERQLLLEEREKKQLTTVDAKPGNEFVDPKDGTTYEWDGVRKAWFPKLDDLFIAKYQENYKFEEEKVEPSCSTVNNVTKAKIEEESDVKQNERCEEKEKKERGEKRKQESNPTWFEVDDEHNTSVYVSNLPLDITDEQFVELMKKCGLLMKDESNNLKIKIYKDAEGNVKGDALCTYIKVESVILALQILDGYMYNGKEIKVERAKFSLKGEYDPSKKPRKKKNKEKNKMKKKLEKLFDWRPEKMIGERSSSEKVVIIKNMFDISEFEKDPKAILEYKSDLRDECIEKCGEVKKVEIYDRNQDGVAAVHFKEFEAADSCVQLMNGRFFAGRQLSASHWDGKTKYSVKETEEEAKARIDQWDKFLEDSE